MPARPPRKCSIVGDGIVTLGVWPALTRDFRYSKSARWMSLTWRTLSITRITGGASSSRAVGLPDRDRDVGLDAAELLEEIDVEVGAPELAVGDALQADVFLEPDDLGDRVVLDFAQRFGVISPRAFRSRASSRRWGRRKLPTWSARKGG
jgi:hypothetical protein